MYLFQLDIVVKNKTPGEDLHSTMYLFQLSTPPFFLHVLKFTFHHVSISTSYTVFRITRKNHLHSTMYLFQPNGTAGLVPAPEKFTFHHVSISTHKVISLLFHYGRIYIPPCIYFNFFRTSGKLHGKGNLHSTMYLFQLFQFFEKQSSKSIYIPPCIYFNYAKLLRIPCHFFIYIPPCIYFNPSFIIARL